MSNPALRYKGSPLLSNIGNLKGRIKRLEGLVCAAEDSIEAAFEDAINRAVVACDDGTEAGEHYAAAVRKIGETP